MQNLLFLLAFLLSFASTAQDNASIYPFAFRGQWGLIDSDKNILVEASLDQVELLWNNKQADGFVAATKNGRQGVLNGSGKWAIKPKMDSIVRDYVYYFPEIVWVIRKGKYGLMDVSGKKGQWLAKPQFTACQEGEGRKLVLFPVAIDNKWGVLNNNGELVAECIYDEVKLFETWSDYPYIKLIKDGEVSYLDAFGLEQDKEEMEDKEMMDEDWDDVAIMDEEVEGLPVPDPRYQILPGEAGETVVTYETYKDGAYQVDKRILVPGEYEVTRVSLETFYYPRGICSITIKKDGRFGFFDPRDSTVGTPPVYDYTKAIRLPDSRNRGNILLKIGQKQGLADRNGKLILPAYFDTLEGYRGLIFVTHESGYQGFADYQGNVFLPSTLELTE